jgi:hypothetical protein
MTVMRQKNCGWYGENDSIAAGSFGVYGGAGSTAFDVLDELDELDVLASAVTIEIGARQLTTPAITAAAIRQCFI